MALISQFVSLYSFCLRSLVPLICLLIFLLSLSFFYPAVSLPDSPRDEGIPEAAGRILWGSEAVSEECLCPEGLFPVSVCVCAHLCSNDQSHFYLVYTSNSKLSIICKQSKTEIFLFPDVYFTVFWLKRKTQLNLSVWQPYNTDVILAQEVMIKKGENK